LVFFNIKQHTDKGSIMKKILVIAAFLIAGSASAQSIFPHQPVDPTPGYGLEGQGLNMARPWGREGVDCVVNPVSMSFSYNEVEKVELVAGQVFTIPVNVLFDFDGDVVRPEGLDDLRGFFNAITEGGAEEILIVGHTDSKGTDEYNLDLGLRRAGAVAGALAMLGFDPDSMEIDSAGESLPKVPNTLPDGSDDPDGRQVNRRVDIEIVKVQEQEVVTTEVVRRAKNPQIFHRLSSNGTVGCAGGVQSDVVVPVGGNIGLTPNGGVVITTVPR
jgi:outer membrane protein OmpA-like peptidoglycan-associated protein